MVLEKLSSFRNNSHAQPVLTESKAMFKGRIWDTLLNVSKIIGLVALVVIVVMPFFVNPLFTLFAFAVLCSAVGVGFTAKHKINENIAVIDQRFPLSNFS